MQNIFVFGTLRSGTSIISVALNAHPNIAITWQPYLFFFKACRNKYFEKKQYTFSKFPMGIVSVNEDFNSVLNEVRFNKSELKTLIFKIRNYLSNSNTGINIDMIPSDLMLYLDSIVDGTAGDILRQLLDAVYLFQKSSLNKKRIIFSGIKETYCEQFIQPIFQYKSLNSKFVHIIRDPRAVVASRNYGNYKETTGSKYPLYFLILLWKKSVMQYIKNCNSQNYIMVKYEDFVENPKMEIKRCCNNFKIEYSNSMIDPSNFINSKGERWRANSSFQISNKISTNSIDKWKEVLSKDEIQIIEYYCKNEIILLNYQLSMKEPDSFLINSYKEDKEQINNWLLDFNFKLMLEDLKNEC